MCIVLKVLHIILPQTNPHPQRCLVLPERCNCITSKSPVLKESTSSFIKSNLFRFPCGSPQWPRFSPRLRRAPWPEGGKFMYAKWHGDKANKKDLDPVLCGRGGNWVTRNWPGTWMEVSKMNRISFPFTQSTTHIRTHCRGGLLFAPTCFCKICLEIRLFSTGHCLKGFKCSGNQPFLSSHRLCKRWALWDLENQARLH